MNFGVQTFTVRKAQKKNIERSYLPLVDMGVRELEIARIDFTPENGIMRYFTSRRRYLRMLYVEVEYLR